MKNYKQKLSIAALAILSAPLCATNVFADNPYGINYTGGQILGENNNVKIEPNTIDELTTLLKNGDVTVKASTSERWKNGYTWESHVCHPFKYVEVSSSNLVNASDNLSLTISNRQYTADVKINKISLENFANEDNAIAVGTISTMNYLYSGQIVYSDATCETRINGIDHLTEDANKHVFAEMNIKLRKKNETETFTTEGLFFGVTDIDAAQSFKILNESNKFTPTNMYAKSAAGLQSDDPAETLKNMYSPTGNYIYSEYDSENGKYLALPATSNIYVPLTVATQTEGLDIVFGFTRAAGSGIEYYAKQYTVTYKSEEGGKITGISDEKILPNENPTGSEATPDESYELSHWVADVDVKLTDGTTIKAGSPIKGDEIPKVVVDQNITFTAVYTQDTPNAPDTGHSTSELNAAGIAAISVLGVSAGALITFIAPQLLRKKTKFNK